MPFTFSHAAAIIPFRRRPYVLSALIAGSISPDFLYFIPFIPSYDFTHSIAGLFVFCLPASLIFLLIYHRLVKLPLILLMPEKIQGKLWHLTRNFSFLPFSQLSFVSVSILLGAATHVLWDSFTHDGHANSFLPWLNYPVFSVLDKSYPIYKLLQYICSVFGLGIFGIWFFRLVERQPTSALPVANTELPRPHLLPVIFSISIAFGFGLGFDNLLYSTVRNFFVQTLEATIGAFFVLLVGYSLVLQRFLLKK